MTNEQIYWILKCISGGEKLTLLLPNAVVCPRFGSSYNLPSQIPASAALFVPTYISLFSTSFLISMYFFAYLNT